MAHHLHRLSVTKLSIKLPIIERISKN